MAKPSTFTRKTTQPPGSGATHIRKPCNTKPKRTIDERRSNGMTTFCGDVEDISDEPIQINWIPNLKNTVHHSYIDNDDMKAEEVPEDEDCIGSTTVPYSANRTCTGSMRKPKHCTWKNARKHQFQIGPEADERRAQRRTLYEMNMIQLLAGSAMVADYDDTEQ